MSQQVTTQKDVQNPGTAPAERRGETRKRFFTPLRIVLIAVFTLLLAAVTTASVIALSYDRIYPNLSAYGVPLSGMTRDEAVNALSQTLDSVYADKAVTLSLDGRPLTITAEEAGVSLSAERTAQAAYDAGRQGGVFSRLSFAFTSLYTERNLEEESELTIDKDAIQRTVAAHSEGSALDVTPYEWTVGRDAIEVRGGADGCRPDPGRMADDVEQAFRSMDFSPLSYQSEPIEPDPLPLDALYAQIYIKPVSAYLILDDTKQAALAPHVTGVSFDMQKARAELDKKPESFTIPLIYTEPELTAQALEESLFRDLIGEYYTSTSGSSANRVSNIVLTTEFITGTILLPGDQFSFNGVVGRRSEERGFQMAGAYINGQLTEDVGGGVCQSSSTLYNAALMANLAIVHRQNHSMTVAYVPRGRDATVDYGNIDFVFANDTGYPIRIETFHAGTRLTVQIWGTKTDDLTVSIEDELLSYTSMQTLTEINPALAPGAKHTKQTGHNGLSVQTFRVLTDADGNEVYRNPEAKSTYRKVDTIIEVGPGAPSDIPDAPDPSTPAGNVDDPAPPPSPDPSPDPEPDPTPSPEPTAGPEPEDPDDDLYAPNPSPSPDGTSTEQGENEDAI